MKSCATHKPIYLYGPIYSRRYGQSLGIDLLHEKICSFNCRFCQLKQTAHPTTDPVSFPPVDDIIAELEAWSKTDVHTDYMTLCGSGEPTLHRDFGKVLGWVRKQGNYKSLLMTNGSLLWMDDVQQQAAQADVVKISLHWWDQSSFEYVVRPAKTLRHNLIIDGYRAFRQSYRGIIDLEVFVIPGFNDTEEAITKIANIAKSFSPNSITLNTATRSPIDQSVQACPPVRLAILRQLFDGKATERHATPVASTLAYSPEAVRAFYTHHPVSLEDLAKQFGTDTRMIQQALKGLL